MLEKEDAICKQLWQNTVALFRGATSSSFWVGNFHEISFDDVIVLLQLWYNFFANGHV